MPRDLFATRSPTEPTLTASPETKTPTPRLGSSSSGGEDAWEDEPNTNNQYTIFRDETDNREMQFSNSLRRSDEKNNLHPYVSNLNISDLEACLALENAAFPENERCSREKFIYRLKVCPELSFGLFASSKGKPANVIQSSWDAAQAPDSYNPNHKATLLGQVVATLTAADVVTEQSMDVPSSFNPETSNTLKETPPKDASAAQEADTSPGHHALGRTLNIHSICMLPGYQHMGLGKVMVKAYLQRMESAGIADKIAILAHPEQVGWYTGCFGFQDKGDSDVKFGGGNWRSLVYEITDLGPGS